MGLTPSQASPQGDVWHPEKGFHTSQIGLNTGCECNLSSNDVCKIYLATAGYGVAMAVHTFVWKG